MPQKKFRILGGDIHVYFEQPSQDIMLSLTRTTDLNSEDSKYIPSNSSPFWDVCFYIFVYGILV